MQAFNSADFRLGILGGGQLGKMLIQSAMDFGIEVHVLDPDYNASCSSYCHHFKVGSFKDFRDVYHFGKSLDLLTIEIENVNVEALKRLQEEGRRVFPQPELVELIQDKGLQKDFFIENGIPTAPFVKIKDKEELRQHTGKFPAVQKLRKSGYDGRGVFKINSPDDLANAFNEPSILEERVDFEKELSVLAARNESGEVVTYDVVEMEFNPEANLVEMLFSPALISPEMAREAREIAVKVIEKLNLVGLLAVEIFATRDGKLLVNELAPRPHNSGHHTIEACVTSQYEQHLRAILNLPLGSTRLHSNAVMVNLLGAPGYTGDARYEGFPELAGLEGVHIHLYSKKKTKPFRKMGHVTITDNDLDKALEKARLIKEKFKIIA
ncbi:5-(carboxyamino)imidazole ribonucleotide synthase [Anseongella ginsenosidimutans]|uniref:N5-carboxyaminoimidazole ribonucleotide synthase n=1 Tax=Anseongella ginsenosidimutans TaxID=496056 RepID=A0A4R3KQ98_9SPHI|nr:5-(carboxyamino)imidazole ribonucleotide synthase [Anseongella ginsenosidimutans]QEC53637.1 5-(carboxyamino)imidazole ribonucleotide synthase [Anseongella ginsenosidimutans]TCS86116.1 5-(carboxyamino)imidazole ribonucleotide synthase [Anseongella ginsenosidimutans]